MRAIHVLIMTAIACSISACDENQEDFLESTAEEPVPAQAPAPMPMDTMGMDSMGMDTMAWDPETGGWESEEEVDSPSAVERTR